MVSINTTSTRSPALQGAHQSSSGANALLKMVLWSALIFMVGFHVGREGGLSTSMDSLLDSLPSCSDSVNAMTSLVSSGSQSAVIGGKNDDGWSTIEVYTGDRNIHIAPFAQKTNFSQIGQDFNMLKILDNKRNGFFVDLASNHPVKLSNTFMLERDYDWNGLCIEPNWQYWNGLASMRKCQLVAAVGGQTLGQEIQFRMHPFRPFMGAFAGIVGEKFDNKPDWKPQVAADEQTIEETRFTVPLVDILDRFGAPKVIDYFSFDVEGAEGLILMGFPFHKYTFKVLNVERPKQELRDMLTQNGYIHLKTLKYGDQVWKHNSVPGTL